MAHYPEGMSIAESTILQQIVLPVDLIELQRDVLAFYTGFDELHAPSVHLAVDLPETELLVCGVVEEHGTLQCCIVTGINKYVATLKTKRG